MCYNHGINYMYCDRFDLLPNPLQIVFHISSEHIHNIKECLSQMLKQIMITIEEEHFVVDWTPRYTDKERCFVLGLLDSFKLKVHNKCDVKLAKSVLKGFTVWFSLSKVIHAF